jgi:hypothetical protein
MDAGVIMRAIRETIELAARKRRCRYAIAAGLAVVMLLAAWWR